MLVLYLADPKLEWKLDRDRALRLLLLSNCTDSAVPKAGLILDATGNFMAQPAVAALTTILAPSSNSHSHPTEAGLRPSQPLNQQSKRVMACFHQLTVPSNRFRAKARAGCPFVTSRRSVRRTGFQTSPVPASMTILIRSAPMARFSRTALRASVRPADSHVLLFQDLLRQRWLRPHRACCVQGGQKQKRVRSLHLQTKS
jgi:hypothetical protein